MGILEQTMRDKFVPTLKNLLFNDMPTFKALNAKKRVKDYTGDRTIKWRTVARKHQAPVGFIGFSAVPTQTQNPLETAALTIAQRAVPIGIPKDEMLLNKGGGEVKLLDIMQVQFKNAKETFQEDICTGFFSTGTYAGLGGAIAGLRLAVHTTNTYATINRSTAGNEYWKANLDATAYTDDDLKDQSNAGYLPWLEFQMFTNATHGGAPDLIVLPKRLYNIHQLISTSAHLRFGNTTADPGFDNSQLRGVDIIFDDYCPAKHMFFLNTADWTVYVVSGANFDLDEENGSIWKVPTEQLAKVAHLLWMGQLKLDSPWRQGVYTALGTS